MNTKKLEQAQELRTIKVRRRLPPFEAEEFLRELAEGSRWYANFLAKLRLLKLFNDDQRLVGTAEGLAHLSGLSQVEVGTALKDLDRQHMVIRAGEGPFTLYRCPQDERKRLMISWAAGYYERNRLRMQGIYRKLREE